MKTFRAANTDESSEEVVFAVLGGDFNFDNVSPGNVNMNKDRNWRSCKYVLFYMTFPKQNKREILSGVSSVQVFYASCCAVQVISLSDIFSLAEYNESVLQIYNHYR